MEYIDCAVCKEQIENDSFFCDQCGAEVKLCVACGQPGKGKRCTKCGAEVVAAKENLNTSPKSVTGVAGAAMKMPVNPVTVPAPEVEKTVKTTVSPKLPQLQLINPSLGLSLAGVHGAVIGRKTGNYANVLSALEYISGTHAKLELLNEVWYVTDLGSTNGTMLNGKPLTPQTAYPLNNGSKLQIATTEFIVELT